MPDPHSETRMYPKNFDQMALPGANEACRPYNKDKAVSEQCPVCRMKIVLHCELCKIQVSGCLCTEERNHGPEIARKRMEDRGIWLPPQTEETYDPNRPINPGNLHG